MSELRIAIVGSRETDPALLEEMFNRLEEATLRLIKRGRKVVYTSGGCKLGPDQLLFRLAHRFTNRPEVRFVCYLESDKKMWLKSYNQNVEFIACDPSDVERNLIKQIHPAPDKLTDWMWLLHCRNINIMSGYPVNDGELVDAVYFAAPVDKEGVPTGGTRTGVSYARMLGVATFNYPDDIKRWDEFINDEVRK